MTDVYRGARAAGAEYLAAALLCFAPDSGFAEALSLRRGHLRSPTRGGLRQQKCRHPAGPFTSRHTLSVAPSGPATPAPPAPATRVWVCSRRPYPPWAKTAAGPKVKPSRPVTEPSWLLLVVTR